MVKTIYLDNNATTALDPEVLEAMLVDLKGGPLNPSSVHSSGRDARNLVTKARRSIATALGALASEIVFTSGGTESINLALRGLLQGGGHVITSSVEHAAVLATLDVLTTCSVTRLSPGRLGAVTPSQVEAALTPSTRSIVLMAANNETGVLTDLPAIARIAEEAKVPLMVDGTAWLGKAPVYLPSGISAVAFSGHKIHGPKGSGLLIVRNGLKVQPLVTGGSQQEGRRGGTENLAGILGLAKAIELIQPAHFAMMERLRDRLEQGVQRLYKSAEINGEGRRVANTANITFPGLDGEALLMNLDLAGVAVSHGAACSSGSLEPSHVLLGMGYSRERAASSIRFSLSRFTTEEEIDRTLDVLSSLLP